MYGLKLACNPVVVAAGGFTAASREKADGCAEAWVAGVKAEDGEGIDAGLDGDGAPNGLGALLNATLAAVVTLGTAGMGVAMGTGFIISFGASYI